MNSRVVPPTILPPSRHLISRLALVVLGVVLTIGAEIRATANVQGGDKISPQEVVQLSRGRRTALESTTPVTVLDSTELVLRGTANIEEILINRLPTDPRGTGRSIVARGIQEETPTTFFANEPNTFFQPGSAPSTIIGHRSVDTARVVVGQYGFDRQGGAVSFNTAGPQHAVRPANGGGIIFNSAGYFFNETTRLDELLEVVRSNHAVANEFTSPPPETGNFVIFEEQDYADGAFLGFRTEGTRNQTTGTYTSNDYVYRQDGSLSIDWAIKLDLPYALNFALPNSDGGAFVISNSVPGVDPATTFARIDPNGDVMHAFQADFLVTQDIQPLPTGNTLITGISLDPSAGNEPTSQDASAFLALLSGTTGTISQYQELPRGSGFEYMVIQDENQIVLCWMDRPPSENGSDLMPGTGFFGVTDYGLTTMTFKQAYRPANAVNVTDDPTSDGLVFTYVVRDDIAWETFPANGDLTSATDCDFLVPTTAEPLPLESPFTGTNITVTPITVNLFDNAPNLVFTDDTITFNPFGVVEEPICAESGGFPVVLNADTTEVGVFGGDFFVSVETFGEWSVSIPQSTDWVKVVEPANLTGYGNGTLHLQIDPNNLAEPRSVEATVNGTPFNVSQMALLEDIKALADGPTEFGGAGGGVINVITKSGGSIRGPSYVALSTQEPTSQLGDGIKGVSAPDYRPAGGSLSLPAGASTIQWTVANDMPLVGRSGDIEIVNTNGEVLYSLTITQEGAGGVAPINMSARTVIGAGDNILIPGFVVGGSGQTRVLARATGPSLANLGVEGTIADPLITLFNDAGQIAQNDSWQDNQEELERLFAELGAFDLTSALDSALLFDLDPGPYTVQVQGADGGIGVGLVELYVIDAAANRGLVNLSARAEVGSGDRVMIPGFVIAGDEPVDVLVRGIGPKLGDFGVTGFLEDPVIEVKDVSGATVGSNDDWEQNGDLTSLTNAFATAGAFGLNAESKDGAVLLTLNPGVYTAIIRGKDTAVGVALLEVYFLREL